MSRSWRSRATEPSHVAAATVVLHLVGNAAHGGVHVVAPVPTTAFQAAVVVVVIVAAPLVAVAAMARGRRRVGGALLAVALALSLLFTGYYHWLSATPDNVGAVTAPWREPFEATAVVVLIADLLGVAAGFQVARGNPGVDEASVDTAD